MIAWSGGTNYSGYPLGNPAQSPPTTTQVQTNVSTTNPYYSFIADATPRTYSITVWVQYTNGAQGDSTMTFTSVRPTASLSSNGGIVIAGGGPNLAGQFVAFLGIYNPNGFAVTATTGPDPQSLSGQFMIVQLINYNMVYTDPNNVAHTLSSAGSFQVDDVFPPDPASPLGQPTQNNATSWVSVVGVQSQNTYTDTPHFEPLLTSASASLNDSFQTYLMYMPAPGGVWIALQEIDWNFSVSATNPNPGFNGAWNVGTLKQTQVTGPTTPSGGKEFPSWNSDSNSAQWH